MPGAIAGKTIVVVGGEGPPPPLLLPSAAARACALCHLSVRTMNDSVPYFAFLVSAGSRGIGAEFVRQFAAKGNRVIAGCRCAAPSAPGPLSTRRQLAPRRREYTGDRQWLILVPLGKRCYDALSKMSIHHLLHAPKAPKARPALSSSTIAGSPPRPKSWRRWRASSWQRWTSPASSRWRRLLPRCSS